jgi:hypothetical protein
MANQAKALHDAGVAGAPVLRTGEPEGLLGEHQDEDFVGLVAKPSIRRGGPATPIACSKGVMSRCRAILGLEESREQTLHGASAVTKKKKTLTDDHVYVYFYIYSYIYMYVLQTCSL